MWRTGAAVCGAKAGNKLWNFVIRFIESWESRLTPKLTTKIPSYQRIYHHICYFGLMEVPCLKLVLPGQSSPTLQNILVSLSQIDWIILEETFLVKKPTFSFSVPTSVTSLARFSPPAGSAWVRLRCWKAGGTRGKVREVEPRGENGYFTGQVYLKTIRGLMNGAEWLMHGRNGRAIRGSLSQGNAPHQSAWLKVLAGAKQTQHCEGPGLKGTVHSLKGAEEACLSVSVESLRLMFISWECQNPKFPNLLDSSR